MAGKSRNVDMGCERFKEDALFMRGNALPLLDDPLQRWTCLRNDFLAISRRFEFIQFTGQRFNAVSCGFVLCLSAKDHLIVGELAETGDYIRLLLLQTANFMLNPHHLVMPA